MSKIRINELARELEVKPNVISRCCRSWASRTRRRTPARSTTTWLLQVRQRVTGDERRIRRRDVAPSRNRRRRALRGRAAHAQPASKTVRAASRSAAAETEAAPAPRRRRSAKPRRKFRHAPVRPASARCGRRCRRTTVARRRPIRTASGSAALRRLRRRRLRLPMHRPRRSASAPARSGRRRALRRFPRRPVPRAAARARFYRVRASRCPPDLGDCSEHAAGCRRIPGAPRRPAPRLRVLRRLASHVRRRQRPRDRPAAVRHRVAGGAAASAGETESCGQPAARPVVPPRAGYGGATRRTRPPTPGAPPPPRPGMPTASRESGSRPSDLYRSGSSRASR